MFISFKFQEISKGDFFSDTLYNTTIIQCYVIMMTIYIIVMRSLTFRDRNMFTKFSKIIYFVVLNALILNGNKKIPNISCHKHRKNLTIIHTRCSRPKIGYSSTRNSPNERVVQVLYSDMCVCV